MTELSPNRNNDTSLMRDLVDIARYYLGGRRSIIALAVVAVVTGLALNWSWLVAAGVLPVLLTALPCVAMCALGLCMHRMVGRSCSTDTSATPTSRGSVVDDTAIPARKFRPSLRRQATPATRKPLSSRRRWQVGNRNLNRKEDRPMRRSVFALAIATTMAVALPMPLTLQAQDTSSPRGERGSMTGPGMMNGKQTSQMMDHCKRMMQGASSKPSEKPRESTPPAGEQPGKTQ